MATYDVINEKIEQLKNIGHSEYTDQVYLNLLLYVHPQKILDNIQNRHLSNIVITKLYEKEIRSVHLFDSKEKYIIALKYASKLYDLGDERLYDFTEYIINDVSCQSLYDILRCIITSKKLSTNNLIKIIEDNKEKYTEIKFISLIENVILKYGSDENFKEYLIRTNIFTKDIRLELFRYIVGYSKIFEYKFFVDNEIILPCHFKEINNFIIFCKDVDKEFFYAITLQKYPSFINIIDPRDRTFEIYKIIVKKDHSYIPNDKSKGILESMKQMYLVNKLKNFIMVKDKCSCNICEKDSK